MTPKPSTTIRSVSITAMLVLSVFAGVAVGNAIAVQESGETDADISIDTNDQGVVEVTNSSDATISGTSSLSSGTEIQVEIRFDNNEFIDTKEVTVDENGNWEVTYTLTTTSIGSEFSVSVRGYAASADGVVVETKSGGSESGIPGFGFSATLVALAAAALVARRDV